MPKHLIGFKVEEEEKTAVEQEARARGMNTSQLCKEALRRFLAEEAPPPAPPTDVPSSEAAEPPSEPPAELPSSPAAGEAPAAPLTLWERLRARARTFVREMTKFRDDVYEDACDAPRGFM